MGSDYKLAIELIENAHALIHGDDWRDQELRTILARVIDLLEEVRSTSTRPSAVVIDLHRRASQSRSRFGETRSDSSRRS